MHELKSFFLICTAAVLSVDNDGNTTFLFSRKGTILKEMRCNQSYISFCGKRNLELILMFRKAGNVKRN